MSKRAGSASAGIFSNSSFWLAAVLSVLLFSWIMYGAVSKAEQIQPESNAESNTEKEKTPVSVASVIVRRSVATKIWPNICISAKSEPSRRAEIMAETHGQVKEILFNKGDYVKKGDALLKLDMLDRAQRKKEIQALIEQSKLEYKVAKKLYTKKFSTETRLAAAKTSLAGARARLKQIEIEIKNTIVRAPFDGFINAQMVEVGDYVTTGRSVVSIVDINPVIFSGDIVEQDIASIKNGAQVVATLLNGKQVSGKISFISPLAKNATRTFRIEVESENKDFSISGGLSAQMCIKTEERSVHSISPAILSLDKKGDVGIKILGRDNIVEFAPVTMIESNSETTWVAGLPEQVDIITTGQGFAVVGQKVKPVFEGEQQGSAKE